MINHAACREIVLSLLAENASPETKKRLMALRQNDEDIAFSAIDHFDSLEAIELTMALEKRFDLTLDLAGFVDQPTLNGFTARLSAVLNEAES